MTEAAAERSTRSTRSTASSEGVGIHAQVPEVGHGKVCCRDELPDVSVGHHPDVLHDLVRRRRLAVTVVPGEVEQRERVERRLGPLVEDFCSALAPRSASVNATCHHARSLPVADTIDRPPGGLSGRSVGAVVPGR